MYRGCLFFLQKGEFIISAPNFFRRRVNIYLRAEKLTVCPATVLFSCKVP